MRTGQRRKEEVNDEKTKTMQLKSNRTSHTEILKTDNYMFEIKDEF